MGLSYSRGEGVKKDPGKAVEWWRKAASQGEAEAQYSLGLMDEKGFGVRQDLRKATEWFRKAAAQGHAKARDAIKATTSK